MNIRIKRENIGGIIFAPSSKSFTQRYVLYSAFSNKPVRLNNVSFSEDEIISMKIAEKCNAVIEYDRKNMRIVPDFRCPENMYVGESGTSYRLSIGLLCARNCQTSITGEPSLARRPVDTLISALSDAGSRFNKKEDGFYAVDGRGASSTPVEIDGSVSSQYVSSMLFYYSILGGGSFRALNTVSGGYLKITENCLANFGVKVEEDDGRYQIINQKCPEKTVDIEGDYSSASYFIVLGIFTGNIIIKNLNYMSLQPDRNIVELINNATGSVKPVSQGIEIRKADHINRIIVDAAVSPDMAPVISVIGIFSEEGVQIYNYQRLREKESDRFMGIVNMCRSFGAKVTVNDSCIYIKKGRNLFPDYMEYSDHRMTMSSIIAGVIAGSDTEFGKCESINKSYPEFLNDLKKIGVDIYFDANLF
ncbi:MAG: 3-phosphoshikimate 1-carboxyvinyltransferase [Ferroplasma sp.]|uniref:3-phosphoshikimate 1-carboxyvinyltransferase n=1 Tax=Ferroplasma sp. TaxID=2591003 RepID=UPI002815797C|nr:3-phosphoshikimate 1-carboxyvinyltransferase [Ferroplasma sp.]WMT51744.1 MAG: 3-phosphoshikimate 1-carboxyvinyltransferase [Ferroplasma sp.]